MTTYVNKITGHLCRKVDPVGMQITVTPENKKYFEQGAVFMQIYGDERITVITPAELKENFTFLTEDEDD